MFPNVYFDVVSCSRKTDLNLCGESSISAWSTSSWKTWHLFPLVAYLCFTEHLELQSSKIFSVMLSHISQLFLNSHLGLERTCLPTYQVNHRYQILLYVSCLPKFPYVSCTSAKTWKKESAVAQSCPTLSDPMDCSPPCSSVHGIFEARILEWVAISFSRGSWRLSACQMMYFKYLLN